eukprot:664430-Rhodomonas_salina.1
MVREAECAWSERVCGWCVAGGSAGPAGRRRCGLLPLFALPLAPLPSPRPRPRPLFSSLPPPHHPTAPSTPQRCKARHRRLT